jgi:hypothetical protein
MLEARLAYARLRWLGRSVTVLLCAGRCCACPWCAEAAVLGLVQGVHGYIQGIIDLEAFLVRYRHARTCKAEMRFSFSVCSVRADRALYTRCSQGWLSGRDLKTLC